MVGISGIKQFDLSDNDDTSMAGIFEREPLETDGEDISAEDLTNAMILAVEKDPLSTLEVRDPDAKLLHEHSCKQDLGEVSISNHQPSHALR